MEARSLKGGAASAAYTARVSSSPFDVEGESQAIEVTAEVALDFDGITKQISKLRSKYPLPSIVKTDHARHFDADLSVLLHREMPLPLLIASNKGFWIWISFKFFGDLIDWRHEKPGKVAHPRNYGLANKFDGYIARLWYRAELSKSEGLDPYELTVRGIEDFWASMVMRRRYAGSRELTRALIRFQYPGSRNARGHLGLDKLREMYKRLQRLNATVALEALSESEASELLQNLSKDLT